MSSLTVGWGEKQGRSHEGRGCMWPLHNTPLVHGGVCLPEYCHEDTWKVNRVFSNIRPGPVGWSHCAPNTERRAGTEGQRDKRLSGWKEEGDKKKRRG